MATGRLREVELDAIRIQTKRFKDDEDERQYQAEKLAEAEVVETEVEEKPLVKVEETNKKGK